MLVAIRCCCLIVVVAARYPDAGDFYEEKALRREAEALKRRSLPAVVKSALRGDHAGIGAGQISGDARLLPKSVEKLRTVRLFKKVRDTDTLWVEQPEYQKTLDPTAFCSALQHVVPYVASTIPGQCAKSYWGARAQQIIDQMRKYVPPRFVPDEFDVSSTGFTGLIRNWASAANVAEPASNTTAAARQPEQAPSTLPKRRYNKNTDDAMLIKLCTNSAGKPVVVSRVADIVAIAKKIDPNLQYTSVKAAIKRLEKAKKLSPQ